MEVRHVHFNLGQCHRQFGQREKPKHVSAPCPQNYKRRPRNWTPLGRIGEPRKSIRGKEMNITDPIYADEDKAREHLESIQWPDRPVCPKCGNCDPKRITKLQQRIEDRGGDRVCCCRVSVPWRAPPSIRSNLVFRSDTKRLGGLVRRPSFLSFRVTTTTSKPTCLRRRLQHTQLGTEISRLLSWPAS